MVFIDVFIQTSKILYLKFQGLKTDILSKRTYICDPDVFICLRNGRPWRFWTELHLMLAMEQDILDAEWNCYKQQYLIFYIFDLCFSYFNFTFQIKHRNKLKLGTHAEIQHVKKLRQLNAFLWCRAPRKSYFWDNFANFGVQLTSWSWFQRKLKSGNSIIHFSCSFLKCSCWSTLEKYSLAFFKKSKWTFWKKIFFVSLWYLRFWGKLKDIAPSG